MSTYAERLQKALAHAGISKAELARRVGVKDQAIQYLCRRGKGSRYTYRIAMALGVSTNWLETGQGRMLLNDPHHAAEPPPVLALAYPVISWVQARHWGEAFDYSCVQEWRHTTQSDVGGHAFYLRVCNNLMISPEGHGFPPGCLILVDPDISAEPEHSVVARHIETTEVTFRKLIYDAGYYYLQPLNPQYRMIPMGDEWDVIGVVREAIMDLESQKPPDHRQG